MAQYWTMAWGLGTTVLTYYFMSVHSILKTKSSLYLVTNGGPFTCEVNMITPILGKLGLCHDHVTSPADWIQMINGGIMGDTILQ